MSVLGDSGGFAQPRLACRYLLPRCFRLLPQAGASFGVLACDRLEGRPPCSESRARVGRQQPMFHATISLVVGCAGTSSQFSGRVAGRSQGIGGWCSCSRYALASALVGLAEHRRRCRAGDAPDPSGRSDFGTSSLLEWAGRMSLVVLARRSSRSQLARSYRKSVRPCSISQRRVSRCS